MIMIATIAFSNCLQKWLQTNWLLSKSVLWYKLPKLVVYVYSYNIQTVIAARYFT